MKSKFIYIIFFILVYSSVSFAGECLGDPEDYLKAFAKANIDDDLPGNGIFCIFSNVHFYSMIYESFASQTLINKIRKENEPTKKMAYKVLPKFLKSEKNKCDAAYALAYYQWPDSFEYLNVCVNDRPSHRAVIYSILGDKRAIPWVIEQYIKIDNKYKNNPDQGYVSKMIYLNALYHLASSESLPFIEDVIKNPIPKEIKARAIKVRKRILLMENIKSEQVHPADRQAAPGSR